MPGSLLDLWVSCAVLSRAFPFPLVLFRLNLLDYVMHQAWCRALHTYPYHFIGMTVKPVGGGA